MSRRAKRATLRGITGPAHPASRYGEESRAEAWRLHCEGVPHARIARTIGCHRYSVRRWVDEREALLGGETPLGGEPLLGDSRPKRS